MITWNLYKVRARTAKIIIFVLLFLDVSVTRLVYFHANVTCFAISVDDMFFISASHSLFRNEFHLVRIALLESKFRFDIKDYDFLMAGSLI